MARTSSILTSAEVAAVGYLAALGNSIAVVTNSSGKVVSSATTATEVGYLSGVTSALQTQLNAKAPTASPTFTGTVTIPSPFTLGSTSVTTTGTKLNYLSAATGTTGTTSTNLVFSTSPTLVTPTLGVASATSINKVTITAPATSATLTIANGKTLTANATLTLTGTDSTTMTFPTTSATIARTDAGNTFIGHQTIEGVTATGATGTGNMVYSISPTFTGTVSGSYISLTGGVTSIYSTVSNTSTATLTTITQGLTLAGNLITSTYLNNGYTAGLIWSSTDDNSSKPKAGIFSKTTGAGSYIIFGTSSSYVTGIVNTVSIDPNGGFAAVNGDFTGTLSSASTLTVGAQASASAVGIEIGNYSGGTPFIDFKTSNVDYNMRIVNSSTDTLYFSSSTGTGTVGFTNRIVLDGNQTFTAASSNAYLYHSTTLGLVIYGNGSQDDITLASTYGANIMSVATGTTTARFYGAVNIGGTFTRRTQSGVTSQFQIEGTTFDSSSMSMMVNDNSNATTAPVLFLSRSRGTTVNSNTVVQNGDRLGLLLFMGTDGTIPIPAAIVQAYVDGTPGANDMPGRLEFLTTPDGSTAPTCKMVIDNTGSVSLGTTSGTGTGMLYSGGATITSTTTTTNSFSVTASSLTTGGAAYIYSNSSSASTRNLTSIINNNTGATATTALYINQKANYLSQYIVHEGTTIGAMYIGADNLGAGGYCLDLVSNSGETSYRSLMNIQQSNAAATSTALLTMAQYAPFYALAITGYANSVLYYLNATGTTTYNVAEFCGNSLTTGSVMSLYSASTNTSTRQILWIRQDSSAATGTAGIQITHVSSGYAMKISQSVNNANACYGIQMNIANAGAGLEYAFRFDGSEFVSAAVGGTQNRKIRVSFAGTDYYIPAYTT